MTASMRGIEDAATRAGKIVRDIDDIAFQPNILALNAAVEAARAGEVWNLAQRAAQAARDTAGLTQHSISSSRDGNAKLGVVREAVAEIAGRLNHLRELADEVAAANSSLSRSVEEVTRSVEQIHEVTHTSEELNQEAQGSRSVVRDVKMLLTEE